MDRASSLDCLLLGHLSLMSPPLTPPRKWLHDALSTKYPILFQWTTNFRQEVFGGPINAAEVNLRSRTGSISSSSNLPWQTPTPTSTTNAGLTVLAAICGYLPIIPSRSDRVVRAAPPEAVSEGSNVGISSLVQIMIYPRYTLPTLVCSAFGGLVGYGLYARSFGQSRRIEKIEHTFRGRNGTSSRNFGEAGRMLGLV